MNKSVKILTIIVLTAIVSWGIIFGIDYYRCANCKMPIFVRAKETADDSGSGTYYGLGYRVEVKKNISVYAGTLLEKVEMYMFDKMVIGAITNIDIYYETAPMSNIEELPENYNMIQAVNDGCVVVTNNKKIFNKNKLDEFIEHTKNDESDFIRCIAYTIEGDMIITDVHFYGNNIFNVYTDLTRDKFSASEDRIYKYGKFSKMTIEENDTRTSIYLEDAIEGDMQSVYISGYGNDYEIINNYENKYLLNVIPNGTKQIKKITEGELANKYDYDIHYYGLEKVTINIENNEIDLKQALLNNDITMEQIIEQAENDSTNEIIWSDMYKEGGTMEYHYGTYTIIKSHSTSGNRDVYIGIPEMRLNQISY